MLSYHISMDGVHWVEAALGSLAFRDAKFYRSLVDSKIIDMGVIEAMSKTQGLIAALNYTADWSSGPVVDRHFSSPSDARRAREALAAYGIKPPLI